MHRIFAFLVESACTTRQCHHTCTAVTQHGASFLLSAPMKRRGKNVQLSEIFPSSGVSQRPHRELVLSRALGFKTG